MARLISATLGLVVLLATGCTPEPASCRAVEGEFWAEYTYMGGTTLPGTNTCPVGPYLLTVDGGGSGTKNLTTNFPNRSITTDLVLKGCDVGLQVTVNTTGGDPIAVVDGDMRIINNDLLMGTVRGQATDGSGQWCDASFEARLVRRNELLQTGCIEGSCSPAPPPTDMGTVFAGAGG